MSPVTEIPVMQIPPVPGTTGAEATTLCCDVAVVGGGTAGTMAAITAAEPVLPCC